MNARYAVRRAPELAAVLFAAAAALWGLTIPGCDARDRVTNAGAPAAAARVPDLTEETSRMRSFLYNPGNPFTRTTIDRLLKRSDVDAVVSAFEERGMGLAPDGCLVIEGVDETETVTRVTLLAMAPLDRSPDEIGVVACFERSGRVTVAPATFISSPQRPANGHLKLADGLWMNGHPIPVPDPVPGDVARWSPEEWNKFWRCLISYVPGPVTTCFVGCMFVAPTYLQCALSCVATQSMSTVVRCATNVLLGGRLGGHQPRVE